MLFVIDAKYLKFKFNEFMYLIKVDKNLCDKSIVMRV